MNILLLALTTAILNFQSKPGSDLEGKGEETALLLQANLSTVENVDLVERAELEKVLSEQGLGLSGTINPDTAAKIGQLTGAKVLVTGRLFDAGGQYFVVAKIISTETSRVFGETAQFKSLSGLNAAAAELARKIGKVVTDHRSDLVAPPDDMPRRLAELQKLVAGKALPSVSVSISEQHVSHRIVDPAAQTQMQNILQQIGFKVVDSASAEKPGVAISGEAFSEMGMRNAGLVSCRARVEIKMTKTADGALLLSDSAVAPGVDISEDVAAKKALEAASFELTGRIVRKLVP